MKNGLKSGCTKFPITFSYPGLMDLTYTWNFIITVSHKLMRHDILKNALKCVQVRCVAADIRVMYEAEIQQVDTSSDDHIVVI